MARAMPRVRGPLALDTFAGLPVARSAVRASSLVGSRGIARGLRPRYVA